MKKPTKQKDGYYYAYTDGGSQTEDIDLEFMGILNTRWSDTGFGLVALTDDPSAPLVEPVKVTPLKSHFLSYSEQGIKKRVALMEYMGVITALSIMPSNAWVRIYCDEKNSIRRVNSVMEHMREGVPITPSKFIDCLAGALQSQIERMQSVEIIYAGKNSDAKLDPHVKRHMRMAHNAARRASGQIPNKIVYDDGISNTQALNKRPKTPRVWPPVVGNSSPGDWQP